MVDVKICGLSEPRTLETALECGADLIGFNFYPPSPRSVSPRTAQMLAAQVKGRAANVAVTVDADNALLDAIMEALSPQFIQAHGDETPERVADIARRYAVSVIKVIKVRSRDDVESAGDFLDCAAMILFDTKAPDDLGSPLPGGNGISFDWSFLRGFAPQGGFILSGGLDASNVAQAISRTGATAVDVSSGVETAPGVKDARLIANFIEAAKRGG